MIEMSEITVLDKGRLKKTPANEGHDYEFASTKDFFSYPANLVTGLGGVSGGRILIGSKATLQSISLVNRQPPLVQSVARPGDPSFVEQLGRNYLSLKSSVNGTVTEVSDHEIKVKTSDGVKVFELYHNHNLGQKTFIHYTSKVKVGDQVKKGDLLAVSNYTDEHGVMAMGTNLRTAVMPYRSANFEDAFVVTESGAKKLEAEQIFRVRLEARMGIEINKNKYVSIFPNRFLNAQLATIDANGVVKKGTIVNHGDPIVLALAPKALKSTDMALGRLSNVLKNAFTDHALLWDHESAGEVVDVSVTSDYVTVNIKSRRTLQVGDKVSCVFGAKGVVGSIVPDARAPMDKDGKPVDIILNSMSITSRVAPALINTLAMGKVAEKLGHPVKMPHFRNESALEATIEELKKHGLKDTEELYDPVSGRNIEVLTGPLYYTRLVHIAEDKESHRSTGVGYSWDMQPTKAEDESAKRIGNLGTAALLSHGATAVLRDIATIKATRNDEYWRRVKLGLPVPSPQVPFIFNKFLASLQGAGINVTKKDTKFHILPMTDKDVTKISSGAINEPLTFQVKGDKLIPEKGGLFDPEKVGVMGERYNHVELAQPIPNPVSEDFLRKLLGVTKDGYMELIKSGQIAEKLKGINVDAKLAEYTKYLKTGKKTKREDALKLVTFLTALKKNGIHPHDLMLSKIPIIPAIYRPALAQGDFSLAADVNYLYKDLLMTSNELKGDLTGVPPHVVDGLKGKQYDAVKAVYGLGDPIVVKNQEKGLKGLLATTLGIRGGSAKSTMFQSKVVNKPMDLVGRAVLTPSAFLDLDEASVPIDTLWKVYLPFISRRLVQKGVPATKAQEYIETRNPLALEALHAELKERPAIISRDPSLHKFNLTGFFLRPNPNKRDKTIKLNPLVFKGLAADNDGDQLNINVPASEEAKQEVIAKMMPSKSLISPKTFQPMFVPSNESALGLFQMSTEKSPSATVHAFKTPKDVVDAFHQGKLHVGDKVKVG